MSSLLDTLASAASTPPSPVGGVNMSTLAQANNLPGGTLGGSPVQNDVMYNQVASMMNTNGTQTQGYAIDITNPNPVPSVQTNNEASQTNANSVDYILRTSLHLDGNQTPTGSYNFNLEPCITGYFISFLEVTLDLRNVLLSYTSQAQNLTLQDSWLLLGATKSITVPEITVTSEEYQGYNDVKLSTPVQIKYNNSLSINLRDTWSGAVYQYITAWINLINPQFPIDASGLIPTSNPPNLKGNLLLIQYDPSWSTIVSSLLFYGIYPTQAPVLNYNIEENQIQEFSVDFNIDRMFFGPQLLAQVMSSQTFGIGGTIPQLLAASGNPPSSVQGAPPQAATDTGNSLLSGIQNMVGSLASNVLSGASSWAALVNPVNNAITNNFTNNATIPSPAINSSLSSLVSPSANALNNPNPPFSLGASSFNPAPFSF